ncbi:hypothetical protein AtEden1_Chr1g0037801 [Arabidopsis thaliana]
MEITRINKYLGIRRGLFPASYTSIRGILKIFLLNVKYLINKVGNKHRDYKTN